MPMTEFSVSVMKLLSRFSKSPLMWGYFYVDIDVCFYGMLAVEITGDSSF